jgi:putative molybdopterin biosynthesis protein
MFKVNLQYQWQPRADLPLTVDATLFQVLFAIHETGSLAGAARKVGMSYRHVWGLMGKWERIFGQPMVTLHRGKGAELTALGAKLLWAEQLVQARLGPELESVSVEIERALSQAMETSPNRLEICASHDLALAQLRDMLAQRPGCKLDLRFQGSIDSLAALAKGQCTLAGFHVAEGMEQNASAQFRRHLKPRQFRLIGLATRVQGLMLAPDNPKRLESLADLMQDRVRFINRQRDSGSRVEFDQLLSGAGIAASAIQGYQDEEFTHLAVAATIAANKADAGYGIKAAAEHYGLHFIPLLTERYYLACRKDALENPALLEFIDVLRDSQCKTILSNLSGYGTSITGKLYDINEAIPAPGPARAQTPKRNRIEAA